MSDFFEMSENHKRNIRTLAENSKDKKNDQKS